MISSLQLTGGPPSPSPFFPKRRRPRCHPRAPALATPLPPLQRTGHAPSPQRQSRSSRPITRPPFFIFPFPFCSFRAPEVAANVVEPLDAIPAAPVSPGLGQPCHGAPFALRSNPPSSIGRNRHRGAAHGCSSPIPAKIATAANTPSPASISPILHSVSIIWPPSTLSYHSLALSSSPGRRRRELHRAGRSHRRQPSSVLPCRGQPHR